MLGALFMLSIEHKFIILSVVMLSVMLPIKLRKFYLYPIHSERYKENCKTSSILAFYSRKK